MASSVNIARDDHVSQGLFFRARLAADLLEEDVKINEATVKAVCVSPPSTAHRIPTRLEASQGTVPEMAMGVVFHPSTNSSAWRWSARRSRNAQWTQSSVVESVLGWRYAYIISWRTKSSKGTAVGRVLGVNYSSSALCFCDTQHRYAVTASRRKPRRVLREKYRTCSTLGSGSMSAWWYHRSSGFPVLGPSLLSLRRVASRAAWQAGEQRRAKALPPPAARPCEGSKPVGLGSRLLQTADRHPERGCASQLWPEREQNRVESQKSKCCLPPERAILTLGPGIEFGTGTEAELALPSASQTGGPPVADCGSPSSQY